MSESRMDKLTRLGQEADNVLIQQGYQAGLKRAAEIAFNESTVAVVPWYQAAERRMAERIEQAILRELSEDHSPSSAPDD